jgi:hypothetical protein
VEAWNSELLPFDELWTGLIGNPKWRKWKFSISYYHENAFARTAYGEGRAKRGGFLPISDSR